MGREYENIYFFTLNVEFILFSHSITEVKSYNMTYIRQGFSRIINSLQEKGYLKESNTETIRQIVTD